MESHDARPRPQVIFMPGGVLPADLAYGPLLGVLGDGVEAVAKDLEVYASDVPPHDFGLGVEVEGIRRAANAAGFERFHLVGYSGGGASSIAFAATYPERLLSLALMEPAWAGWEGLTPEEEAVYREFERIMTLPPDEMMGAFMREQLRPGVEPPAAPAAPPGPPPPWMARRPAGLAAFMRAFRAHRLDLDRLRAFDRPVWFALGGLSDPDYYARMSERLAGIFPRFTVEVFPERHHFDPPHRREPERVAAALRRLWNAAEGAPAA
ncbi:MAG: alpha/beta hydrolase [Chloroflexi bacterium GWC2_73_18]|nr:MAG: alpha/beta hydrolase [Chloroflexi bacterium GWC2_73_18]